jgi:hypothetical protein
VKVMVIVKATKESEAGVMLAGEGLHPSAKGVRMRFPKGTVTDGPFGRDQGADRGLLALGGRLDAAGD